MKKSWKTTLGGSLAAFGTFLFGAPIALSVMGKDLPKYLLISLVTGGFILQGAGVFFTGLFGRDNDKTSEDVGVDENTKLQKRLNAPPKE